MLVIVVPSSCYESRVRAARASTDKTDITQAASVMVKLVPRRQLSSVHVRVRVRVPVPVPVPAGRASTEKAVITQAASVMVKLVPRKQLLCQLRSRWSS